MSFHHRDMPDEFVHAPHSWRVANEGERLAIVDLQEDDIGKRRWQADPRTEYALTAVPPAGWDVASVTRDGTLSGDAAGAVAAGSIGYVGLSGFTKTNTARAAAGFARVASG